MAELNIGALTDSKSYTGSVGTANIYDLYKFNINSPGSFKFSIDNLSGNADIFLLDNSGATLYSSTNAGTAADTISADSLIAGDYTLKVVQISGDIKYRLNLAETNTQQAAADTLTGAKADDPLVAKSATNPEQQTANKDAITGEPIEEKTVTAAPPATTEVSAGSETTTKSKTEPPATLTTATVTTTNSTTQVSAGSETTTKSKTEPPATLTTATVATTTNSTTQVSAGSGTTTKSKTEPPATLTTATVTTTNSTTQVSAGSETTTKSKTEPPAPLTTATVAATTNSTTQVSAGSTSAISTAETTSKTATANTPTSTAGTTDIAAKSGENVAAALDSGQPSDKTNTATNNGEETKKETTNSSIATAETTKESNSPTNKPITAANPFTSGKFVVDSTGKVSIDYLLDGGFYRGQLAIISLKGMEKFVPGSAEFLKEAAGRALSNSEKGHIVIDDLSEGARFSGNLPEGNFNEGSHLGVKTFAMTPGDEFGFMLVPNDTVKFLYDYPGFGGDKRPLFSMVTANPNEAFHLGQLADLTGEGNTFAMEDMRFDLGTDKDYNDIIFQVRGAKGKAALMDDVVNPNKDWRKTDLGKQVLDYATGKVVKDPVTDKPIAEPPVVKDPVTDKPIAQPQVVKDPVTDKPISEPPVVKDPVTDKPIAEPPVVKDPVTDKPISEPPVVKDPVTDKPISEPPVVKDPVTDKPISEPPVVKDPVTDKPISEPPVVKDPVTDKPISEPPVVKDPVTDKPISEPQVVKDPVTDKPISEPQVVKVPVTDKPISEPPVVKDAVQDRPIADEPNIKNPVQDRPIADEPNIKNPVQDKPISELSVVKNPVQDKPISELSVVKNPVQDKSISDEPIIKGSVQDMPPEAEPTVKHKIDPSSQKLAVFSAPISSSSPNSAPVVTASNQTVNAGASISPSFSVSDANGDRISNYYFSDLNSSSTSGYFTINGVKQTKEFTILAEQLSNVRFVGGSVAGTDSVSIAAYDGKVWAGKVVTMTTQKANQAPVVTASNQTVNAGASITPIFSVTDADGDRISHYYFSDLNSSSTSGYFTLNGTRQNGPFTILAEQLSNVRFVGGSVAGTDSVSICAYDGKVWAGKVVTMTTQKANQAPVVTASNQTVNAGASITPSFSVTDADGDRISHYYFSDLNSSSTSGYFTLNGTRQNGPFTILAEQLSNVRFVGGSVAGTDSVSIAAYDGKVWAGKVVTMTTQKVNQAPVVTASNQTVNVGASITPNFSVTDADGDRISLYYFYDQNTSSTSGYFTVNGVQQTSGFSVTPEQLSTVRFVGGSVAGTDSVTIYASDGQTWGSQAVTMTTKANQAPVVTASNQTVNVGASITPNFSVTDADGDRISLYYFYDSNTSSTSGYFTVNGVQQSSAFSVTPEQLSTVRFVGGSVSGTDSVTIYASDGQTWGSQAVTMTTKANQAPVVTATNQTVNAGASIVPNFSVTDADGDRISLYYFLDSNTSSTSGYFTLNGVQQSSAFSVTPEQLSTVRFVGGSVAGTDSVTIYAYDGQTWGSQAVTMTTKANQIPFVTVSDQTVRRSQTIQPSFGVTDADGDKITRYAFYDNNNSSTSGYFTVNGAAQAAEQTFYVDADKLSTVRFVGGSTAGSDYVYARAYDGTDWSNWNGYTIQTQAGSTPTVSASDQTVTANESIKLSLSATDADGDKITSYKFYDANTSSTSGYFTVNGAAQAAGQTFYVDADKLDTVRFVGGTAVGADAVYVAAADGVDGWGAWKPFNVSTSAAADWFEKNIKDLAIRSLARSRFQDGWLDRQDMIDIFRDAKDGGVVDANEFADLQALTKNTDFIKMPDHVRVLSAKIAEGNPANNSYQGSYLGNLYAGSSDNQLEKLIQEHFFGGDRPLPLGEYSYGSASNVVYRYAEGNLFLNGVSYEDVRQGSVGDCYYLASLASVALKTPDAIREMFIDNGDGTYTVRFFNKGKADYVTVDRYLPVNSDGTLPFAKVGKGKKYDDSTNELWVALAEKAYAQMNEASWLGRLLLVPGTTDQYVNLNGLNSYKGIENGWSGYSTDHISNKKGTADWIQSSTPNTVVDAFNYGKTIIFSSKDFDSTKLSNVVDNHAYTMVGYNQATGLFKLFNPWGVEGELYWSDFTFKPGIIELTWNQIQRYFSQWTVNG